MSRSRKKTPIFGNGGGSDKVSKQIANKSYRAAIRNSLHRIILDKLDPDEELLPTVYETTDEWDFDKDGKRYIDYSEDDEHMRK